MTPRTPPDGYHSINPYLIVDDAAAAIQFYTQAFNAVEQFRLVDSQGGVGHAEVQIGDSRVMMADANPAMGFRSPHDLGGAGVSLLLYVDDVDAVFAQAVAAGGRELRPVTDQFYGDRAGTLGDPFGHSWTLATHQEDVSQDEIQQRFLAMFKQTGGEQDS